MNLLLILEAKYKDAVAKALADFPHGVGMFTAGYGPKGAPEPTHYVSHGSLPMDLIAALWGIPMHAHVGEPQAVFDELGVVPWEPAGGLLVEPKLEVQPVSPESKIG